MNADKKARLEAAGWKVGSVNDFLETPERRVRITFIDPCFGEVLTTVNADRVPATVAQLEAKDHAIESIALLEEGE